jgi:hypothetical protein
MTRSYSLLVHEVQAQKPDAVVGQEELFDAFVAGQVGHCKRGVALSLDGTVLQHLRTSSAWRVKCLGRKEEEEDEGPTLSSFLQHTPRVGWMAEFCVRAASAQHALRCTTGWEDSARRHISYMRRMLHFVWGGGGGHAPYNVLFDTNFDAKSSPEGVQRLHS